MDIKSKITITLTPEDVKGIIAEYLTHKGYEVSPNNVELFTGTRWEGYGYGEHMVHYFEKCIATVKAKGV